MWWNGAMLGIDTWQDLSAVIVICTAIIAAVTWLVRVTVVRPLRSDIRELGKTVTTELALDANEPLRDRVVRHESDIVGLRGRVNRLEGDPHPHRG